jgi:glycosyltransferase involved in cell wall biosynthesis
MYPKISIVTVVYNDVNHIEATINSVLNQTYKNIEYCILDGGSFDGTLEIVNKYTKRINNFVSEKDDGIYDAMNKGIYLSSGDYILFLNSGDEFVNYDIIEQLANYILSNNSVDVLYGDVKVYKTTHDFMYLRKSKDISNIKRDMVASHQSCLIKRELHLKENYDLKYKLASDYNFILKIFLNGATILRIPLAIAIITDGGVSDLNRKNVFREKLIIKNELTFSIVNYVHYYYDLIYMNLLNLIKNSLSKNSLRYLFRFKYNGFNINIF